MPDNPNAPGVKISLQAQKWWHDQWQGKSFMAIGMQDPALGSDIMKPLRHYIRGCPAPLELAEAGHFVQEWGNVVAQKALESFT